MRPEDDEDVARLSGELGYPATAAEIRLRFSAATRTSDAAVLVAESAEGEVVGWLHVLGRHFLESESHAEVGGLVVSSHARRQGVGRALMQAAELWASSARYGVVRVRSNVERTGARAFYEALGYEVIKTQNTFRKTLG